MPLMTWPKGPYRTPGASAVTFHLMIVRSQEPVSTRSPARSRWDPPARGGARRARPGARRGAPAPRPALAAHARHVLRVRELGLARDGLAVAHVAVGRRGVAQEGEEPAVARAREHAAAVLHERHGQHAAVGRGRLLVAPQLVHLG